MLMVVLDLVTIVLFLLTLRLSLRLAAWGFKHPSERWVRVQFLAGAVGLSAIVLYCMVYIMLMTTLYALLFWATFMSR